jgi:hypothetical protein
MTTTLPAPSDRQGAENQWAVEAHGMTKRFGENIAVNEVELLVPLGCALRRGVLALVAIGLPPGFSGRPPVVTVAVPGVGTTGPTGAGRAGNGKSATTMTCAGVHSPELSGAIV